MAGTSSGSSPAGRGGQGRRRTRQPVPRTRVVEFTLAPSPDAGQQAEVRRLEALGARRADVGQDPEQVSWVVMADPEGNEFCVLSARE